MEDMLKGFAGDLDEVKDPSGNGLLTIACQNHDEVMLKLLLTKGRMDPNSRNIDGNTPLHFAAAAKYYKCIDLLIQHGACEVCVNTDGISPWEYYIPDI